MKSTTALRRTLALLCVACATLVGAPSWAITGTAAGETILNSVTLGYTVGSAVQDGLTTSVSFLVDRKMDVVVAKVDTAYSADLTFNGAAPGETNSVLTFTVTNGSNFTPELLLYAYENTVATDPIGGATGDNLLTVEGNSVSSLGATGIQYNPDESATSCSSGALPAGPGGSFIVPGTAFGTGSGGASDDVILVCIFVDIPLGSDLVTASVDDGDYIPWSLVAAFADPDTAGAYLTADDSAAADTAATENVFADLTATTAQDLAYLFDGIAPSTQDAAQNGQHVDTSAYVIRTATLTLTKTSLTVWDPINGFATAGINTNTEPDTSSVYFSGSCTTGGGNTCPHAIPGAIVQYHIVVSNSGSVPADAIEIRDTLDAQVNQGVGATPAGSLASVANDILFIDCADAGSLQAYEAVAPEVDVGPFSCAAGDADIYYFVEIP